ncbi:hypothetical protein [Falsiroseomonas ponticola]|jgi:hypothetical protein|uniref:hypothetical protein n=1 Tax=Falsiroseomonas ponticola TaxID=2786951 RepID=UPI0019330F16|nr:hypothetical protein [Roseomonas ponticola]
MPDRDLTSSGPTSKERPATRAERGVFVPFTAPMLWGARMRRIPGSPPELLLPSLSGRGTYVLDWRSAVAACTPSLHDRQLWARLSLLHHPTPAGVRSVVRKVALMGHAGRPAQAAAEAALEEHRASAQAVKAALLKRLPAPPEPPAAVLLGGLADLLADCGCGPAMPGPQIRQVEGLDAFCTDLSAWTRRVPAPSGQKAGLVVLAAARHSLAATRACLAALWPTLEDLPGLLARGPAGLRLMAELVERPDWMLDGWPPIAALWAATALQERSALAAEVAAIFPVPAEEADRWPGAAVDWDTVLRGRRLLAALPVLAGTRLVEMAARNESLRAMTA